MRRFLTIGMKSPATRSSRRSSRGRLPCEFIAPLIKHLYRPISARTILAAAALVTLALTASKLAAQSNTRLSGTVVNGDDGAPVLTAEVRVIGSAYRAVTDGAGYFAFDNLPPGRYRLDVSADGYQRFDPVAVEIVPDVTRQLRLVLTRKLYPVSNVTVRAKRPAPRNGVVVVGRQQIDSLHAQSTADILESIQGVYVEQTGPAGQTQVRIRGSSPEQVLVLLDGQKINSAGGVADLGSIPVTMIERIEVHKGGTAARFGPEALGGVVNIVTQPSGNSEPTSIEGETGLASWDTRRYQVTLVNPIARTAFSSRVAISDNSSQGDFDYTYRASPTDSIFKGTRRNNPSSSRSYFVSGRWQPGRTLVGLSIQDYSSGHGLPGAASRPTLFASREDDRRMGGVRVEHQLLKQLKAHVRVGAARFSQFFRDRSGRVNNQFETRFAEKRLDVQANIEWQPHDFHRLQIGGQIRRDALDHIDYMREAYATGKTVRTTNSAYVNHRFPIDLTATGVLDDLTLTASLRYDRAVTDPEKKEILSAKPMTRKAVRTESWSPHFGVTVSRGERLHLSARAGWGKSLRLPSVSALFWLGDARVEGNPNLKPERSEHLDGGIEIAGRHRSFELSAGLTVYRKEVDDLVIWVQSGPNGAFRPDNLGAARITGHEDFVRLKSFDGLLEVAYTNSITHARNKQRGHNSLDKWLTYTPRYVTTLSVQLRFESVHAGYDVRWVDRRFAAADNTWWYDAYTVHDVTVGAQIGFTSQWRLQIDGHIRNVGDEQYVLILQHPMPGREFGLTLRMTFIPKGP